MYGRLTKYFSEKRMFGFPFSIAHVFAKYRSDLFQRGRILLFSSFVPRLLCLFCAIFGPSRMFNA